MANSTMAGKSSARGHEHEARATKRRRVEEPPAARPPVKIAVSHPHGRIKRTVNGVRTDLSIAEDDTPDARDPIQPEMQRALATADATSTADQKRVLRSQDGGQRLTSDLSHFFPDYEESIFAESKPPELLTASSSFYVTDDKSSSSSLPIRSVPASKTKPKSPTQPSGTATPNNHLSSSSTRTADASIAINLVTADPLDLSAFEKEALDFYADPLPDSEYLKAHRRGERHEKQMRNVEKERAQHEKWELERLYDELRGPDWLKTMGISGITETEKKKFESKRDHYVGRVKALLAKFEKWRENEKEVRMKKERAVAAKAKEQEEEDDDEANDDEEAEANEEEGDSAEDEQGQQEDLDEEIDEDTASIDSAALQLIQEAQSAQGQPTKPKVKAYDPVLEKWDAAKPFTSFYTKSHERAAAVGKHRRGRHVSAFGHPLPHMEQEDFDLPDGFLTWEEIRDNERKKRRQKRESAVKEET